MNFRLISQLLRGLWMIRPLDAIAQDAVVYSILTDRTLWNVEKFSDKKPFPCVAQSSDNKSSSGFDNAGKNATAIISMSGTMIKYGTMCNYGTQEVAEMITEAANHKNINSIVFCIDSGGGAVDAIAPLTEAILHARSLGKPVVACCDLCASAAYWVATCCDRIVASNSISSEFGSIGVMCSFVDTQPYYEQHGYKFHEIYSDLSTNKNEAFNLALEGKYDLIKEESLNPLARSFQNTVKTNRPNLKISTPGILSGKMFFSAEALDVGLIDEVGSLTRSVELARDIVAENTINNYLKT